MNQLSGQDVKLPSLGDRLTEDQVVAFAKLALSGMDTEYPNKPGHVFDDPANIRPP